MTDHVSQLLSPYMDGQITLPERQRVEKHLSDCAICRAELAELRALTGALRRLPQHQPSRSFVLGPRAVRPPALSGTWAGYLRAMSSIAAALAVVAVSLSLAFQGLPRQSATLVAAPAAPQADISAARAAQPAASAAAALSAPKAAASVAPGGVPAQGAAAARPAASTAVPAPVGVAAPVQTSGSAKPAPPGAAAPVVVQAPVAQRVPGPINIPRLVGELLVLFAAISLAVYSIRWWR